MKESAEQILRFFRQFRFIQRAIHQLYPAVARLLIQLERHVPHAKARMTALLHVSLRSAEAADEKVPQAQFGAIEIVLRIHGTEDVIGGNLPVKRGDEALETFFADLLVDIAV